MRYMRHIIWLLLRPIIHPFIEMRRRSEEERKAELAQYQQQQQAALQELKIELLLAHRQGVRDRTRAQSGSTEVDQDE